jgi:site-specific recombinase XerD
LDSDDIYNYTGKIASVKRRLEGSINCAIGCQFLDALSDYGLSKGRVTYYAGRLPPIMAWFDQRSKIVGNATKDDCRSCLRDIMEKTKAGDSKRAFAETLKKLIHFAKKEEIGEKKDGRDYVDEVAWIRPRGLCFGTSKPV